MKTQNIIFLSVIFLTIFCILLFYNQNNINLIDNFDAPAKTYGNMSFDYLNNKDYNKKIIDKYYVNDDTKFNKIRLVNHPYQVKTDVYFGNNGRSSPYIL